MIPPNAISGLDAEQQRALLRELLEQRAGEGSRLPMSLQQQALWYDYRSDPTSTAFNVFLPTRLQSAVDVAALRRVVEKLVERHASLRTTFGEHDGELVQQIHPRLMPEFQIIDAQALDEQALRQRVGDEAYRPFDLEQGPMLRMALFKRGSDDWVTVATTHHIVVDFWSLVLLLKEIRQLYPAFVSGHDPELPRAVNNYRSFVQQQRELLQSKRGELLRRYWHSQLRRTSHVLDFPTDYHRPARFTNRGAVVPLTIQGETASEMERLAKECGATLQALVLAVLQVLVSRYTGQDSFLIGSPFADRSQQDYESTVGFFVNMLPLRSEVSHEESFRSLVRRASRTLVNALEHQELPLAEIIRGLNLPRDASRSPLFQVSCTFEKSHVREEQGRAAYLFPADARRTRLGGTEQESFSVPVRTCHYDLEFVFERTNDGLRGMICYCRDLFERNSIQLLANQFAELAEQLIRYPDHELRSCPWSSANSEQQSVGCAGDEPKRLLMDHRLDEIAEATPSHVALSSLTGEVNYAELMQLAETIASSLRHRGIGCGDYVPVVGRRGPDVVAALLGVIRCGATVVPIDADQPAVTVPQLLNDTGASFVLTDSIETRNQVAGEAEADVTVVTAEQLISVAPDGPCSNPRQPCSNPRLKAQDLCYVIYTSGSSGRPKGVMIEHGAIDNTLRWRASAVPVDPSDRALVLFSHQFDAGLGLILGTLVQGGCLVWPEVPAWDIEAVVQTIVEEEITVLMAVPSLLSLIADHPHFRRCTTLRLLVTGGEQVPSDLPERLRGVRDIDFWNLYGPTEAAIEVAATNLIQHDSRRVVPIGTTIPNTDLMVLDSEQRELPSNVPGELAIAGRGLARGYLNDPQLTAERFPRLPSGRRVFLTGDRGRRLPDGQFQFLGRIDHQLKIAGHRVELEEIEQVLRQCRLISEVAVSPRTSSNQTTHLVAFVVVTGDEEQDAATKQITLRALQQFVVSRLPSYKRPHRYQVVSHIPKTSGGKVDRKRLSELSYDTAASGEQDEPRTSIERAIADAWAESLGLSFVGAFDNFFELGGTSLKAAAMAVQLSETLGVRVPTALLFDVAEPARIAERLAALHPELLAAKFGHEAVRYYADRPAGAGAGDASRHPLIADLRMGTRGAGYPEASSESEGEQPCPLFLIHPPGGIVVCYRELARHCGDHQAVYAIRSRGLHGEEPLPGSLEVMAAEYVQAIRQITSGRPVQIGGWSLGGIVAYEAARQLQAAGEVVQRLILFDTALPESADAASARSTPQPGMEYGIEMTLRELGELSADEQLPLLWEHAKKLGVLDHDAPQEVVDATLRDLKHLFRHHVQLASAYEVQPVNVPMLLIRPRDVPFDVGSSADRGWSAFVDDLTVEYVAGHHHSMMQLPHVKEIAELIREASLEPGGAANSSG